MYLMVFLLLSATFFASGGTLNLFEGDSCGRDGTWTCELFSSCETAPLDITQGRPPEICGYDPDTNARIICCRPSMKKQKRISQRKCEEYSRAAYVSRYNKDKRIFENKLDCGPQTEQLIVGGKDAALKEFPHQVHIGYGNMKIRAMYMCGGSLISDKWVLSAAHCTDTNSGLPKWARLGELDYKSDNDGAEPKVVGIKTIINHEGYTGGKYNDIALFELAEKITLSPQIRPLCLEQPGKDASKFENSAIASGWGRLEEKGEESSILQKVTLNYVTNEKCNAAYIYNKADLPAGIISSQLCAGNVVNKDTCQGDSGGPLQRYLENTKCMFELVGLTSFGPECGKNKAPSVYTRVSSYVPWIEKIVWPNE